MNLFLLQRNDFSTASEPVAVFKDRFMAADWFIVHILKDLSQITSETKAVVTRICDGDESGYLDPTPQQLSSMLQYFGYDIIEVPFIN